MGRMNWTGYAPRSDTLATRPPSPEAARQTMELSPQNVVQMLFDDAVTRVTEARNLQEEVSNQEGVSYSEMMIVAGGVVVVFYYLDLSVKAVYFKAVSYLDMVDRDPAQYGGWKETLWRGAARFLRRAWVPLWWCHRDIQADAVHRNFRILDDEERLRQQLQVPPPPIAAPVPDNVWRAPARVR